MFNIIDLKMSRYTNIQHESKLNITLLSSEEFI